MPLRRFAPVGALLVLAAVACRDEAVTSVEVAEPPSPTTAVPVTVAPASSAPASSAPTTAVPVTVAPASSAPTTAVPVTVAPASSAPASVAPTTEAPVSADGSVIELVVVEGELVGGARRESVPLGEEVTIRVSGAGADEVHVHGYDLFVELSGGSGELAFTADIPGVFEVELEGSGTLLVQMEVK